MSEKIDLAEIELLCGGAYASEHEVVHFSRREVLALVRVVRVALRMFDPDEPGIDWDDEHEMLAALALFTDSAEVRSDD